MPKSNQSSKYTKKLNQKLFEQTRPHDNFKIQQYYTKTYQKTKIESLF